MVLSNNLHKSIIGLITLIYSVHNSPSLPNQITIQPDCDPRAFTRSTWNELDLDHYLLNYPGGQNLTVQEYAASIKASNFKCGISEWCNAGQMCFPVKGRDWYILFAVQEWNERVNSFYNAVGYTMSLVRASLVDIISSLFPQPNNLKIFSQKTHFELGGLIAGLIGSIFALLPFLIGMPSAIFAWSAGLSILPASIVTNVAALTPYKESPVVDAFSDWSEIGYRLSEYQNLLQKSIQNKTQAILDAGISTADGLRGTLSGGEYLDVDLFMIPDQIEGRLKNVTLALSLGEVLKSMDLVHGKLANRDGKKLRQCHSFHKPTDTKKKDPCDGPGPNGAWIGDDVLSYCNPNGTMFNIIRASSSSGKHAHAINKIPNAVKISEKFGFSTEYLTQVSIDCVGQGNRGGEVFPRFNSTTPSPDAESKCVTSLPVCDCRSESVKSKKNKIGTLRACREAGFKV